MHRQKTILYVDDYADNRRLIQHILEAAGYVVIQAGDGGEALQLMESTRPDLALIDLHLPDVNGYELGARLRALPGCRSMPIISITAGDHDREAAASTPGDGYIQKPFELEQLLLMIRNQLGGGPKPRISQSTKPRASV